MNIKTMPLAAYIISINVGKKFLNIVKQSFPNGHPLRETFNKNTLRVSYPCMPSLDAKISAHNKSLVRNVPPTPEKYMQLSG